MTEDRYLVRRADGQVILLTFVLYLILLEIAHDQSLDVIASDISGHLGQYVSMADVSQVIDTKLKPLGVLCRAGDQQPALTTTSRADPLLSLTLKGTLVPARAVRLLTTVFRPLFWPPVVAIMVLAFAAAEFWTFGVHGISSTLNTVLVRPVDVLPVIGLVMLATLFHEIGHATACRYGGGRPGRIGYGVYLMFPAFYTDVTDAYRLSSRARVRTDLGGVYFNSIFIVASAVVCYLTGYVLLLPVILFVNFEMVQQMLPVVRMDGYYVLADWVGIPDLFSRIKPILSRRSAEALQLRRKARRIVRGWVYVIVPVIAASTALFIWRIPEFARTTWASAQTQWQMADLGYTTHRYATLALAVISLILLAIPLLGLTAFLARLVKRAVSIPKTRTSGRHYKEGA